MTLGNLNNLVAEYEVKLRSLDAVNEAYVSTSTPTPPLFAAPFTLTNSLAVPAPAGSVSPGEPSDDRYKSAAVVATQDVMGRLRSVPAARSMFDALPTSAALPPPPTGMAGAAKVIPAGGVAPTDALSARDLDGSGSYTDGDVLDPPMLVDAWGGPILYVPPGGLDGVTFEAHGPAELHRVTSKGALEPGVDTDPATADGLRKLINDAATSPAPPQPLDIARGRGLRPFFASAGPDGFFTTGDDNLYSFEP